MALCARSPQVGVGLNLGPGCGWSGAGRFLQSSQAVTCGGGGDAASPARAWPPLLLLPPASPSRERSELPTSPLSVKLPRSPRPLNKNAVELNSGELEDDTGSGVQEKADQNGTTRVKLNSGYLEDDADSGKQKEADHHLKELLRQIVGSKEQLVDLVSESPDKAIIQENLKELLDLVRESPDNSIIQEKTKVSSCSAGASGSGRCSGSRNTRKNSEPREGASLKARSARLPSRDEEVEDGDEDPYPPPFLKCALCGRSSATFYQKCCATPVCNSCCCVCEEKTRRKLPKVKLEGADLFLWSKTEYEALPRNPLMLVSARRVKYMLHYSFAPIHQVVDENNLFLHLTTYSFYSSATATPPWSSRGSIHTQVVTKDSLYG